MNKMIVLLMLIPSTLFAQNSICGINFGTSYENALSLLDQQFGISLQSKFEAEQKKLGVKVELGEKFISYENKNYAGINWDNIYFHFQEMNDETILNGGMLLIVSNTLKEAEENRDKIKELMSNNYEIDEYIDEDNGLKMYVGGFDPTNPDECGFIIEILESSDGKNQGKYSTSLLFGPYDYTKSASAIKPTSICGVKFGTIFDEAKTILENQFGTVNSYLQESNELFFMKKKHEGFMWDYLTFGFLRDGYNNYLKEANFYKLSNSLADAEKVCEGFIKKKKRIYEISVFTSGEDGLKKYIGKNPKDPSLPGFTIDIIKTEKGEYGTILSYKPFNEY